MPILTSKRDRNNSLASHNTSKGPATGGEYVELPPLQSFAQPKEAAYPYLSGSGSSSKVLYTLGGPATLPSPNATAKSSRSESVPGHASGRSSLRRPASPGVNGSSLNAPISPPRAKRTSSMDSTDYANRNGGFLSSIRRGSNFVKEASTPSPSRQDFPSYQGKGALSPPRTRKASNAPSLSKNDRHRPSDLSSAESSLTHGSLASSASSISLSTPPSSAPPTNHAFHFSPDYALDLQALDSRNPSEVLKRSVSNHSLNQADSLHSASSHRTKTRSNYGDSIDSTPTLKSRENRDLRHTRTDEDGPMEEIVPWMFEKAASSSKSKPPVSPRTRQTSFAAQPSSGSRSGGLKSSKSTGNLQSTSSGSLLSSPTSPKKSGSPSKGFFSMLRRKASTKDLEDSNFGTVSDRTLDCESKGFRDPFPMTSGPSPSYALPSYQSQKKSSTSSSTNSKRKKQSSKSSSLENSDGRHRSAAAAAAAASGITLDMNWEQMDGIIDLDTMHSQSVTDLTAVNLPSANSGFGHSSEGTSFSSPSTPDSAQSMPAFRRRPSLAPTLGAIDSAGESPEGSPMAFGPTVPGSRRTSLAPDNLWGQTLINNGFTGGPAQQQGRKSSGGSRDPMHVAAATAAALNAANAASAAGWIAPESWAVKGDEVLDEAQGANISDEEAEDLATLGTGGLNTPLMKYEERRSSLTEMSGLSNSPANNASLRPGSAGGVQGKRPNTGQGQTALMTKGTNYTIRIFKPDGTHTTISAPFTHAALDLQQMIAKKPGFATTNAVHRLFLRERGYERVVGPYERPIRVQLLRLEQAGYTEWDRPEELGREDHSYLIKYIYKPEAAPLKSTKDDTSMDGFEYIDLRERSLITLPIFLHKHAQEVISLNISRNPNFELPTDFVQLCTSLRELRMASMAIKRVPQSAKEATGLTRLDISNNRILELDHIALDELKELIRLEAHNNRIFALPDYFSGFRTLKYMNLSNNKFEVFPPILCQIPSLVDLDLSFNALTSLPDSFDELKSLQRLILVANMISTLPRTFASLTNLQELDCRYNSIDAFDVLNNLPKLTELKCDYNKVVSFNIASASLRVFCLSNNAINSFALQGTSVSLTELNLSHAKLSAFDVDCSQLLSLEVLNLDNNQIRTLPDGLTTLINLTRFSCRENKLESLPEDFGNLIRLQYLNVSRNDMHTLPVSIWHCVELLTLNISSNMLTEFPDPPPMPADGTAAEEVDRKQSAASKVSAGPKTFAPMALTLQFLYLADNSLRDEIFHVVSLMSELRVLNLSFNDIQEIPHRGLAKSIQLEELYLSGNKLSTLPEDDIERLANLRIIHLNANKLTTLPAELGTLKKLHALDVGNNMLKYNIANWKYDWNWNWNLELRYLNLSGNKRLEIKPAGPQNMHGNDGGPSTAKRRNLSDFSALRKIRTLGLMDVTLTIPSIPDDNEDRRVRTSLSEINDMGYGIADTLGRGDHLAMIDLVAPRFRNSDDECVFGIFDGQSHSPQGAARIARYLQDCFTSALHLELNRMIEGEADVTDVLRRTFLNVNRDYGNILLPSTYEGHRRGGDSYSGSGASDLRSGASGVVAYIAQKTLHVANVGRALAVIAGRNGVARPLTTKHKPLASEEWVRIRAAEGWVSTKGLLMDQVDVSRSFGHFHVSPSLNAAPSVQSIELTESDELVILANRGVWDYIDYQAAVDIARAERADPTMASQKLRDLAISYGSTGHLMVMVVSVGDLFKVRPAKQSGPSLDPTLDSDHTFAFNRPRTKGNGIAPGERYLTLLDREVPPPTGSLALVFTDIRNSTSLWDTNPAGMQVAMRMHNQLLRRQLRAIGGYEVKTEGDAFMVSFPSITAALLWCFTCQLELLREEWPQSILDSEEGQEIISPEGALIYRGLSVRMGIHWGQPVCETDPITRRMDYFGPMVNRSARVSAVAEGGQISASADAIEIIRTLCGVRLTDDDQEDGPAALAASELDDLDDATKRDVTAIRNMGVGITELGERRLKGLETPEFLSLVYPKALAGRLKYTPTPVNGGQAGTTEMFEPVPQLFDVHQIQSMGVITLRLEAAASKQVSPQLYFTSPNLGSSISNSPHISLDGSPMLTRSRKKSAHPHLANYPIRVDATDEELMLVLEGLVIRVENVVNTLTLAQLGPYNEILGALNQATKIEPKAILQALRMFATLTGQNRFDI